MQELKSYYTFEFAASANLKSKIETLLIDEGVEYSMLLKNAYTLSTKGDSATPTRIPDKKSFGKRGLSVLELLAQGLTYNEIAEQLGISVDGVRFYVKKVFRALNVNNGRDAVRIYLTEFKPKSFA